jgi:PIN domain nuclease of toxin-antitoxin system
MTYVLDACALLALLKREAGAGFRHPALQIPHAEPQSRGEE